VKSFPRRWFQEALMYEPIEVAQVAAADEWMYELRQMQDDESTYNAATMLPLFMLVRGGASPAAIQKAVRDFRLKFAKHLGPKDVASLDHLLESPTVWTLASIPPE